MALEQAFYVGNNVVRIARSLVGSVLCTRIDGRLTTGIIVETEAYSYRERGCHAYAGRRTARNEVMFGAGGHAYVYLCYGIHYLFNVVTNVEGRADAILVRALEPLDGVDYMLDRMRVKDARRITSGPGKLTRALGIDRTVNGIALNSSRVWIDPAKGREKGRIAASHRIGIDYAGKDAALPWRFSLEGNVWVSK